MVVVKHTFHAFEVHAQKTRSFITRIVHSMERNFLLYLILERLVCQLFLQGQATRAHCPFQLVMSDLEGVKWEMAEIHGGWLRGASDMPSGKDWHPLGSGQIDRMMQNRHHRIWVPSDFGGMWEVQMVDSWIDGQTKYMQYARCSDDTLRGVLIRGITPTNIVTFTESLQGFLFCMLYSGNLRNAYECQLGITRWIQLLGFARSLGLVWHCVVCVVPCTKVFQVSAF